MTNLEYYKDEIILCGFTAVYQKYVAIAHGRSSVVDWLCEEHKEPILDDVEREYLSNVIRPFEHKDIMVISKQLVYGIDYEYIRVWVPNSAFGPMEFPPFRKGTMYKGMKLFKEYTLKELEL